LSHFPTAAVNALAHFPDQLAASPTPILVIDLDVHQVERQRHLP